MRHALKWITTDGNPDKRVAEGWETDQWYELYRHELGRWSSFFCRDMGEGKSTATLALNQPFWTARRWANDHYNEPSRGKANVH